MVSVDYQLCNLSLCRKSCLNVFINLRLVGDNVDLMVNARIQGTEHSNRSIHWTQQYAVLNRVNEPNLDTTRPRKSLNEVQLIDLLPAEPTLERLKQRWAVLVSRIICKYLPKFHPYRDVVIRHIPHHYSDEMKAKSKTVSVTLIMKLIKQLNFTHWQCLTC